MNRSLTQLVGRRASFVLLAGAALFLAACTVNTTEASDGPFYSIATSIADSAKYPAGTVLGVKVTVTHDTLGIFAATVGYSVSAGGGRVSAATTTTDSLGTTTVSWLLSDTVGVNSLVIASGDRIDTLSVIGVVGPPASLLAQGSDSVTTAASSPVTLQARVSDRVGNPVVATPVNWTTTGGTISGSAVVTDTTGVSQVTFTAATSGTYFVTAALPGQATHMYQILVP
jgi:hypothetical protein